jgi:hypothetical protein
VHAVGARFDGVRRRYGVEPEHFDTMKKALFATLSKELGSLWTAEVEAAWDHSYAVCREMMEVCRPLACALFRPITLSHSDAFFGPGTHDAGARQAEELQVRRLQQAQPPALDLHQLWWHIRAAVRSAGQFRCCACGLG